MTIRTFLINYTDSRKENRAARTIEAEYSYIRLYISPLIGNIPMWRLSSKHINLVLDSLLRQGKSRTAEAVFVFLHSALKDTKWARAMFHVERPRHKPKIIAYWTESEAAEFLQKCDPYWRPVWILALCYGLRRGEICGLKWQNIDEKARILHVNNQIQRINGNLVDSPPKSAAGVRDIPLGAEIIELLQGRYTLHQLGIEKSDYIFPGKSGGAMNPSSVDHALQRDISLLGMRRITVHGLRHTMAALAIRQQSSIRVLQVALGHASVNTTSKVYAHVDSSPIAQMLAGIAKNVLYPNEKST